MSPKTLHELLLNCAVINLCLNSVEALLNFTQIASTYGLRAEEHTVQTADEYILTLHRIPGDRRRPVLLMHGCLDTDLTFLIRGPTSLAACLSSLGYDVWLGNNRGTPYSRKHAQLNPDDDKLYWNFSFHEMGVYDLPAFIDYVLSHNNVKKLSLIGHSMGNMQFYILGALKPEYNEVVNVAVALGPVAYLNAENYDYPISFLITVGPLLNQLLLAYGEEEVFGKESMFTRLKKNVCTIKWIGYLICGRGILSSFAGGNDEPFESDLYYNVTGFFPSTTSRKNLIHLFSMAQRNEFAQYHYGREKNLEIYKSTDPPKYDLSKVTMKLALFVSENDKLTPMKNTLMLKNALPNVIQFHVLGAKKYNHIDFNWGRNVHKHLFYHITTILEKYAKTEIEN